MKVNIVEVKKPNNEMTMDEVVSSGQFIGVVSNVSTYHKRYLWNCYYNGFINCDGSLNPPFESLRKALTDNKAVTEVHIFNTAKELYQWLLDGEN
jgi:hypothetical protein